MPVAEPTQKRNPIPAGEHILTLVSVVETLQPDFNDPNVQVKRWIWQFRSNQVDEETGEKFEHREYTGPRYGNAKARFTVLADMMFPNLDEDEKRTIDTDEYTGKKYKAKFVMQKNTKNEPKPVMVYIEPYTKPKAPVVTEDAAPAPVKGRSAPAPVADDDDENSDPFAED